MKRLVITNDCDGASLAVMKQVHDRFRRDYGLPFSESCWAFSGGVSLLDMRFEDEVRIVKRREPDFSFLKNLVDNGAIDVLHTWGDFPEGGFSRDLVQQGLPILESSQIRFIAWTAHGGEKDFQNLAPLGKGDIKASPYYHMDYTKRLGIRFFSRNTDIAVSNPPRRLLESGVYFKRFRGPSKDQVRSITLRDISKQIELAEKRTIWHRPVQDVILYTHMYAEEDRSSPLGWRPVEEFRVSEDVDNCLRQLAERRDRGEIEVLSLSEFFKVKTCEFEM